MMNCRLPNLSTLRAVWRLAVALAFLFGPIVATANAVVNAPQTVSPVDEHEEQQNGEGKSAEGFGVTGQHRRHSPDAPPTDHRLAFTSYPARQPVTPQVVRPATDPFRNGLGTPYRC
jgi:hypothetical protein